MNWVRLTAAAATIVAVLAALPGCDAASAPAPSAPSAPRIASLSPAITRTLHDLGLGPSIVGRSAYCRSIDQAVPVVGDLNHVDYERLLRLAPTHVLVQPPAVGIDAGLQRLADEHGWVLATWKLETCEDIRRLVRELPGALIDAATPVGAELQQRAQVLAARIDEALRPDEPVWRGRLLLVDSTAPILVYGRGTYLAELAAAAGASNAAPFDGWGELSLEDVARLDPEAVVVVSPSAPAGVEALGALAGLDVAAVREGRFGVLRHPDAVLPSSAVVEVATALRGLLESFGDAGS